MVRANEILRSIPDPPDGATRNRNAPRRTAPPRLRSAISDDDTDESDLDLLVDPTPLITLLPIATIQLEAERFRGVRVDVLTPKSLPKTSRDRVLLEANPV